MRKSHKKTWTKVSVKQPDKGEASGSGLQIPEIKLITLR